MGFLPHVYGEERVQQALSRALDEGRVPHTMIFYGDEGLGKRTAALDFAGRLAGRDVLEEIERLAADKTYEKELLLTAGAGRVYYIRPLGAELKIDQFRAFLAEMASFDGLPHVCIIDEAQTMGDPIANAILKTLEEPEGDVYFILVTHDLEALLPTVISRAERFAFTPLSRADYLALASARKDRFRFENAEAAEAAYLLSEGNPGLTLEMFSGTGTAQPDAAMELWELISESETPFADGMGHLSEDRKEFRRMLRWMVLIGRDIMVLVETADEAAVRCRSVAGRMRSIAPCWDGGRAFAAIEVLKMADAAAGRYISVKNIWDMVLISLVRIRKG